MIKQRWTWMVALTLVVGGLFTLSPGASGLIAEEANWDGEVEWINPDAFWCHIGACDPGTQQCCNVAGNP